MRKILIALLLAVLLPAAALAEAPPPGALVFDGRVDTALFMEDGRIVYVPLKMNGDQYLPTDELRCRDREGNLLWSCAFSPGKPLWGGPHQLPDGSFGLVVVRENAKRFLETFSQEGAHLSSQALPDGLIPLILTGNRIYGTRQGMERHQLNMIGLDGSAQPHSLPGLGENATLLWAWPRGEGHFVLATGKLSQEEDYFQRKATQVLLFLDQEGHYSHQALLEDRSYLDGFGKDALINDLGGITSLVSDNRQKDVHNTFSVICFDEKGEQRWNRRFALDARSVEGLLIDQDQEGVYTVWGTGKEGELDSSGFLFRMTLDAEGKALSITGWRSAGWLVRYVDGQPYAYNKFESRPWLAPLDALPEMEVRPK